MPRPVRIHPPTDPTGDLWPGPKPAERLEVSNHGVLVDGQPIPWPLHGEPIRLQYHSAPAGETWATAYLPLILMSEGPVIDVGQGVHVDLDSDLRDEVRYFVGVTDDGLKVSCRIDGPIVVQARPIPVSTVVGEVLGSALGMADNETTLMYPVSAAVFHEWQADDQDAEVPCTGQCDPDGAGAGECTCPLADEATAASGCTTLALGRTAVREPE